MLITLSGLSRGKFRADIVRHRAQSNMTDADYATRVLGVSLNTYKKCVEPGKSLALKRHTFNNIVANANLESLSYGAAHVAPARQTQYGGYTKAEFGFLVGRYFLHRRSFLTAENITRAVLDIEWSDARACLSFTEQLRYVSDGGVPQSIDIAGDIYMHSDRMLLSLLAIEAGEVRLTLLHTPSRRQPGQAVMSMRAAGVVLTHGFPKRLYQPVVSPVAVEEVPLAKRTASLTALCKTLKKGMPEFDAAAMDLKIAEEHATVMTPLMWRSLAG